MQVKSHLLTQFAGNRHSDLTSFCAMLCLVTQSCQTLRPHGACQAALSMEFSRQEYWSGLQCPPPGDLPNPGIKSRCSTLQVDSLLSEPPGEPQNPGVGRLSLLQGELLDPGMELGSPAL